MIKQELLNLISQKKAVVGVIGLGYVGLPLIAEFTQKGFSGIGFEVDERKVAEINAGRSYIPDVPSSQIEESVKNDRLQATTDFSNLKNCDVIIICVPTPLRKTKDPDMSYILTAAEEIQKNLRPNQLIILESTTYPGTTDEILLPMFEEKGFKLDQDFLLAFSPERVDPGNPQFQTHNIPKVVGGCTNDSTEVAAALYGQIVNQVHAVTSARVAEAAKLWENTFRAVNIGMANEMARLCRTLGIDTWEVIRAAKTKPFGFMAFYPGPGIGGHCLIGDERVIVKSENGELIKSLKQLFDDETTKENAQKFEVDGAEVVFQPSLQALSLNQKTELPEWRKISYIFKRKTHGKFVTVTTSDNRKLTTTDRHPFLVVDASGQTREVLAENLKVGERLPIHVSPAPIGGGLTNEVQSSEIDILPLIPKELHEKIRVRLVKGAWKDFSAALKNHFNSEKVSQLIRQNYLPLADFLALEKINAFCVAHDNLRLYTGRGPSTTSFPAVLKITPAIARLIGYYLAEGCATKEDGRERVRFSFHRKETEFIEDVRTLLKTELGLESSVSHSKIDQVTHIRVASVLFGWFLIEVLQTGRCSTEMQVPDLLFSASVTHRYELLKGLLRGDGDVYVKTGMQGYTKNERFYRHRNTTAEIGYFSSSPQLFQQVVYLLQTIGFTPTFKRTKPHLGIKGRDQIVRAQNFLGTKGAKIEEYLANNVCIGRASKTFKYYGNLCTVPIKSIEIFEPKSATDVYSIEVEETHTFATSYGIFVHNCIPLDPHYLSWKARQHGFDSRFISLAEEVNSSMPNYVLNLVTDSLNDAGKAVKNSNVLILGVAYKKDIDDMRESPALSIIDLLRAKGANVQYHDPYVSEVTFDHAHTIGAGEPLYNTNLTDDLIKNSDCVIIVTEHSNVDYKHICQLSTLVVDTRNALTEEIRNSSRAKIVRL